MSRERRERVRGMVVRRRMRRRVVVAGVGEGAAAEWLGVV